VVILYLLAVVAANLLVTRFGPVAVIPNSFVFIALDLVARDHLHESWRDRGLPWRMALLIFAGSVLSWLLNRSAGPIALASCVAFAAAATVDALVFHVLKRSSWLVKVNVSNIPAAVVDSVAFLWIAFGVGALVLAPLQIVAKIGGGMIWSIILQRRKAVPA
jgi:hypothetical protein